LARKREGERPLARPICHSLLGDCADIRAWIAARMDFAIRTGGGAFVVSGFAGTATRALRILVRT